MPQTEQIPLDVQTARDAVAKAEARRAELRWRVKPNDPDRVSEIEGLVDVLNTAMRPLRSHIGRAVWEPLPEKLDRALREVSKALQYERRQLKKMLRPT